LYKNLGDVLTEYSSSNNFLERTLLFVLGNLAAGLTGLCKEVFSGFGSFLRTGLAVVFEVVLTIAFLKALSF
jgi:hypothetical protein